jgi:heptose I phosphotransferase
MTLFLRDDLAAIWSRDKAFQCAANQQGEVFRAREGRRTLRFEANGKGYFLKYHAGVGWKEILKNLCQGKLPVISAMSEVRAIKAVAAAGIDTMSIAAFGERGNNPAHIESFVVTDDLTDTLSLEQAAEIWAGKLEFKLKRQLIKRLAEIARRMHAAGVNHRDFYLCHFLIKQKDFDANNMAAPLYLIDLHRSQVRTQVPNRWLVKDLGGLYFSAAPLALSKTDLLRFVRDYTGTNGSNAFRQQPRFWRNVQREAERLYRRFYHTTAQFPLQLPEAMGDQQP